MDQSEIYLHIGTLVKMRRKELGLTQQKLASRLGISRASLANVEVGRQSVLVHQLFDYAETLGLAPQDFLLRPVAKKLDGFGNIPLPADLKPSQKAQLARLISGVADSVVSKE